MHPNWTKHHEPNCTIFSKPFASTFIKIGSGQLEAVREYPGIKGKIVAYNSPLTAEGVYSNYFPQIQTIKLFADEFLGFNGVIACSAIGLLLSKIIVCQQKELAVSVFKANDDLLNLFKEVHALVIDEKQSIKVKLKVPAWETWRKTLNDIMSLDRDTIGLNSQNQELFFKKFWSVVLYDKIKNNSVLYNKITNCSFILESAFGSLYWGLGQNPPQTMNKIDDFVRSGAMPIFEGQNKQGEGIRLAWEMYNAELKAPSSLKSVNEKQPIEKEPIEKQLKQAEKIEVNPLPLPPVSTKIKGASFPVSNNVACVNPIIRVDIKTPEEVLKSVREKEEFTHKGISRLEDIENSYRRVTVMKKKGSSYTQTIIAEGDKKYLFLDENGKSSAGRVGFVSNESFNNREIINSIYNQVKEHPHVREMSNNGSIRFEIKNQELVEINDQIETPTNNKPAETQPTNPTRQPANNRSGRAQGRQANRNQGRLTKRNQYIAVQTETKAVEKPSAIPARNSNDAISAEQSKKNEIFTIDWALDEVHD